MLQPAARLMNCAPPCLPTLDEQVLAEAECQEVCVLSGGRQELNARVL